MEKSTTSSAASPQIENGANQASESLELIVEDSSLQEHQANEETTTFLLTRDQDPPLSAPPTIWPQVSVLSYPYIQSFDPHSSTVYESTVLTSASASWSMQVFERLKPHYYGK